MYKFLQYPKKNREGGISILKKTVKLFVGAHYLSFTVSFLIFTVTHVTISLLKCRKLSLVGSYWYAITIGSNTLYSLSVMSDKI